MFDITKLDDMVRALLDRTTLARGAQVNKKWNKIFAPFVWKTIPKSMTRKGWRDFRKLVLEDYQQEQQRQKQTRLQQGTPPLLDADRSFIDVEDAQSRSRTSLAGLKKLEELHIPNMDHWVEEVAEVEWMVEHWPHLSKIIGLAPASRAYKWLKDNHPKIQLE
ncbi:hypothetical protein BGZ82_008416 [Podila clonocystis]|nr:hypothetical protein BGZ82_008416 [Podila clonocystis]